jgi:hypothetical protein
MTADQTSAISRFSNVVNQIFSLDWIATASNDKPIDMGKSHVESPLSELPRINNMLIKLKGQPVQLPEGVSKGISDWVGSCLNVANDVCDDMEQRYAYLTIDNQPVMSGNSQRSEGWHLDGLQGDEVPNKFNNCFQFLWVSNTPTEFCQQSFEPSGLDVSKHNIFKAIGRQVRYENCFKIKSRHTYLMHCFHAHRATKSACDTDRLFLRLYISHCPVTSVRATLNARIKYPFKPHVTTGQVPEHLLDL